MGSDEGKGEAVAHLATRKRSGKKQSEFQKLWTAAEKLKKKNARFRERLDDIMRRISTDIGAAEEKAAQKHIPLLLRLLALGQRKSLAQWQRQTLDDWIREILELVRGAGHLDDGVIEEISRYDAFRLGIELDETAATPLHEQLQAHLEQEERLLEEEDEIFRNEIRREVERILDRTLGPEPPRPEPRREKMDDFFPDELEEELQRQYDEYQEARNAAREELLAGMLGEPDGVDGEDDGPDFDFDLFDWGDPSVEDSNAAPAISNDVFKRLFRSTAAQLHPDREHDPDIRKKKHALMSQLLDARKQGDVMVMVQMYQEYAGEDGTLPRADERQLLEVLKRQVEELRSEQEAYSFESPLHRLAYERFYFPSPARTDQAFRRHIQEVEKAASEAASLARSIKSLKALKPHLERRYEERRYFNPLDAFFDPR